jgi:hypothetical protein
VGGWCSPARVFGEKTTPNTNPLGSALFVPHRRCRRAKLFRMVGNEWKERGTGNVKLNKHKVTGKVRHTTRAAPAAVTSPRCGLRFFSPRHHHRLTPRPHRTPPLLRRRAVQVRLIMRQEKTLKVCANHLVDPHTALAAQAGSDRECAARRSRADTGRGLGCSTVWQHTTGRRIVRGR